MNHKINVTHKEGQWKAEMIFATSSTETAIPYEITAPSQTMLLEMVSCVIRSSRHGKVRFTNGD